jgi:hypothetical protein
MDFTIGNHEEWLSLYQTEDLDHALAQAARSASLSSAPIPATR